MSFDFFKQLTEAKLARHMDFQDMDISIEIAAGGKRTGVNKKTGEAWEHKIADHYGYIKGTHSPDGEHLDCYVRRNPNKNAKVYVMHQLTVDGSKFDEDKVMLGYDSAAQAKKAFKSFTFKPGTMFGGMTEFDLDHFLVVAYQASKSKAMLTDRSTYADFVKRGLMPHGIHSPLTIARRVSESLGEGLAYIAEEISTDYDVDFEDNGQDCSPDNVPSSDPNLAETVELDNEMEFPIMEGFVVVVHTQVMENIGTAELPKWATAGTRVHLVSEAADFGEARSIAARVAAGQIPVEISEGEYVLGIDALTLADYRQFHETVEDDVLVIEELNDIEQVSKLAGVKIDENPDTEAHTPRDWAAKLEALEARRDPEGLEEKKDKRNKPGMVGLGWPWWHAHDEEEHDQADDSAGGDFGGGDGGGMGEAVEEEPIELTPAQEASKRYHTRMYNLDQPYLDRFGEMETPPECTCDDYQLKMVGCDCDQDSWQYAQTVKDARANLGITGPEAPEA